LGTKALSNQFNGVRVGFSGLNAGHVTVPKVSFASSYQSERDRAEGR
jgi:hypothetical protein